MQNSGLTEKSGTLYNIKNLFSYIKMGKEMLTLGNTEIEQNKFYRHKTEKSGTLYNIKSYFHV